MNIKQPRIKGVTYVKPKKPIMKPYIHETCRRLEHVTELLKEDPYREVPKELMVKLVNIILGLLPLIIKYREEVDKEARDEVHRAEREAADTGELQQHTDDVQLDNGCTVPEGGDGPQEDTVSD
jgi:hypothetical protein